MDDIEHQLASLLHAQTPDPPRRLTAAEVQARAEELTPRPSRTPSARRRVLPLLAAMTVILAAGAAALVTDHVSGHTEPSNRTDHQTSAGTSPSPQQVSSSSNPPTSSSPTHSRNTTPTSTPAPGVAVGPTPPVCATTNLRLSSGPGVGAGGTSYETSYLTNAGTTTCTMYGYPAFAGLVPAGNIVQHPAGRDPGLAITSSGIPIPERIVTLRPNQRASFIVASTDTVPNPDCPAAYSIVAVQVYPPNQTQPIRQRDTDQNRNAAHICDLRVSYVFDSSQSR